MVLETPKEVLEYLVSRLEQGEPMLILAPAFGLTEEEQEQVPTIHNFYPKKYYQSIDHCGFGLFEGQTEHGGFNFDAGGAMSNIHFDNKYMAWSPLRTDNAEVLKDLGYDFGRTIALLKKMLKNITEELKQ